MYKVYVCAIVLFVCVLLILAYTRWIFENEEKKTRRGKNKFFGHNFFLIAVYHLQISHAE